MWHSQSIKSYKKGVFLFSICSQTRDRVRSSKSAWITSNVKQLPVSISSCSAQHGYNVIFWWMYIHSLGRTSSPPIGIYRETQNICSITETCSQNRLFFFVFPITTTSSWRCDQSAEDAYSFMAPYLSVFNFLTRSSKIKSFVTYWWSRRKHFSLLLYFRLPVIPFQVKIHVIVWKNFLIIEL